jgi:hypothetical protein
MLEQKLPGRRKCKGQIAKVTPRRVENLNPKGFAISIY